MKIDVFTNKSMRRPGLQAPLRRTRSTDRKLVRSFNSVGIWSDISCTTLPKPSGIDSVSAKIVDELIQLIKIR